MKPQILVVGAGALAQALGKRGVFSLVGMRRRAQSADFPLILGDAAEEDVWRHPDLPRQPHAILISATPGLRAGGSGNRLPEVVNHLHRHYPHCPWIYTGSTAVYGASDKPIDDDGPVTADGRGPQLLAIEEAVLAHPQALVLRIGAIVGAAPSRRDLSRSPLQIAGDPQRPFPYIHQRDLVDLLLRLLGDQQYGRMNVVAPHACSYADYYQQLHRQQYPDQPPLEVLADPQRPQPWRHIVASRLWRYMPEHAWLKPWQ